MFKLVKRSEWKLLVSNHNSFAQAHQHLVEEVAVLKAQIKELQNRPTEVVREVQIMPVTVPVPKPKAKPARRVMDADTHIAFVKVGQLVEANQSA